MVTQIIIRYVDDNYSIRREQFETFGIIIKYLSNTPVYKKHFAQTTFKISQENIIHYIRI